jgi:hypothetical protein
MTDFVEENCTFTQDGKHYTLGGSWIIGEHGLVYIVIRDGKLIATNWHGKLLSNKVIVVSESKKYGPYIGFYKIKYYNVWIDGQKFYGRHNPEQGEALRIRKAKSK